VVVSGFWMDRNPLTNEDFRCFVDATAYRTVAERTPDPGDCPGDE
jgi:formylglycine-generating enzyme required for sulfatase activity